MIDDDDDVVTKSSSAGSTDGRGGVCIKPNKDVPLSQLNEGPRWVSFHSNQSLEGLEEKFEEDALLFEMFDCMSGGVSEERKTEIRQRLVEIKHQKIARWDKPFTADSDDELQNALILHGATHLRRVSDVEQTGQYETVTDVVLAVLLAEHPDPRFTAALGPILIHWADWVDFEALEIKLKSVSKLRRLGWLVENIIAASSGQLLPCSLYPRLTPP